MLIILTLIVTHDHVDFDALAAAVGASKLYPGGKIALPEPLHANVQAFVNLHRDLLPLREAGRSPAPPSTAVVVDTRKKARLGPYLEEVEQAKKIYIYDHHPPGDDDLTGEALAENVGAVTTLLVEQIRRKGIPLNKLEATLMVLGIYEDTGCLAYRSTTPRDVAAAAYLWASGIQPDLIQEYLRMPLTSAQKALLEKLIQDSEFYHIQHRRLLLSTASMDEYVRGAAGLFRYLQDLEEVDLAVILVQMEQSIYLAARSLVDDLNLVELLGPLGVKGHPGAVAGSLRNSSLEEVKVQLLELLEQFLPPAATVRQAASSPVELIDSSFTVAQASDFLYEKGISGCPVMEEGRLVGIISRRDLQKAARSNLTHAPVKAFMRRPVVTVSPGDSLTAVRRLMAEKNIGRVPVVGADGKIEGIVTRSDILRALYTLDRRNPSLADPGDILKIRTHPEIMQVDNLAALIAENLPARLQSLLLLIGQRAAKGESTVYLVGGVIRDLLLGCPAPQDLDFVVIPDAIAFARELQSFLDGTLKIFEQFGTASLFLKDGLRLDLVTARKEFYAAPAALPRVESSSLKNDLYRRDFTINTLACSLMPDSYGQLFDFFNGREDLSQGIIRSLYNLSFVDDPLRIIRAARFEVRFGFTIEENTLTLIEKAVKSKVLEKLSRQRLNQELSLVYREADPPRVLKRLAELGALPSLYYRLQPTVKTWRRLGRIREALQWASLRQWRTPPDPELVYLCGLLYDLDPEASSAIMRRLQFSRQRTEAVLSSCRTVPEVLKELCGEKLSHSAVVNRLDPLPGEALVLLYAEAPERAIKDYVQLYLDSLQHVRPRLRGGDLKQLGLEPGPLYGIIMDKLREAILDGKVRTPAEEREFIAWFLDRLIGKEGAGDA